MKIGYWELRKIVAKIIPRQTVLRKESQVEGAVKEKGRKSNYHQFHLGDSEWRKLERLLNVDEVASFLEVSLRAQACPMPLNLDVWDGLLCPYGCRYCFADAFRASLYTAFFDNSRSMGIRHCNPTYYKKELDILMKFRGEKAEEINGETRRAIANSVPIRFGIRFEDFNPKEGRTGVSLELLRYLADIDYPVMINTKSSLIGTSEYADALADNKGGTAVHITLISSNESFLKKMEPGAPSFAARLNAAANLTAAGVRVVARIEPFMVFLNDDQEMVEDYMEQIWAAGIRHITFDTYSYSANNPGIRAAFYKQGWDFDRMFLLSSDSQAIGSLLLSTFMEEFRAKGFSCSTFDMGSVPDNDQSVCCEVGDLFQEKGAGLNYGSAVMAVRYVIDAAGKAVSWGDFHQYVTDHGGFLSDRLELSMKQLWNMSGNPAYFINWAPGVVPAGQDENGMIWKYDATVPDFRENILKGVIS